MNKTARSSALTEPAPGPPRWVVSRSSRTSLAGVSGLLVAVLLLALLPYIAQASVVQTLTSFLILVMLAVTWNALAGYGGLVSVGQQAYIGFGAYAVIYFTQHGIAPYLAVVAATLASGLLALVLSPLLLRLRGGQFAVGTWVVAEVIALLVTLDKSLGGGTGISLRGLNVYPIVARRAYTFWLTLLFAVLLIATIALLLRRRTGVALQAIRDDEEAAASVGVRTRPLKLVLFVLAGLGAGAAGALTLANTLFIEPQSIFGVQYTAYMIFMVIVGGLGTFEGPILGAIIFFVIQNQFADLGAWYLIGLGLVAMGFALLMPRGLWSLAADRLPGPLLPLGYRLNRADRKRRLPLASRRDIGGRAPARSADVD